MEKISSHTEGMSFAIAEAKKSLAILEVPVGAAIFDEYGYLISTGYNKVEALKTQTAHAEVEAIVTATSKLSSWRLNGCWLYVTLEPCLMCLGLILLSRINGICFGTTSTIFGTGLEKKSLDFSFYEKNVHIVSGVQEKECSDLLQLFFKSKREK